MYPSALGSHVVVTFLNSGSLFQPNCAAERLRVVILHGTGRSCNCYKPCIPDRESSDQGAPRSTHRQSKQGHHVGTLIGTTFASLSQYNSMELPRRPIQNKASPDFYIAKSHKYHSHRWSVKLQQQSAQPNNLARFRIGYRFAQVEKQQCFVSSLDTADCASHAPPGWLPPAATLP